MDQALYPTVIEAQDEFIYILEGQPTLVTASDEMLLEPGRCAGRKNAAKAPLTYEERRAIIGDFQASATFSFSDMSFDEIKNSMNTYAQKVMPELRRWSSRDTQKRAA